MRGRHQDSPARPRLRWLVAVAGGSVFGALLLGFSAGAAGAGSTVTAIFGVTGVSTDNCPVSIGGSDIYVKPGQDLDVKSSLAGIIVANQGLLSDLVGNIASIDGALTIDPKSAHPTKLGISTKVHKVARLATGNHPFTWRADRVTLLGVLGNLAPSLKLTLSSSAAKAGARLNYSGTIHVTSDAAKCGVAVQVPGVSASASVKGLPPINIGIAGVKVTAPVSVPNLNPSKPAGGGGGGGNPPPKQHGSGTPTLGNVIPVPAQVVPRGDTNQVFGDAGFNAGSLSGPRSGGGTSLLPSSSSGAPAKAAAGEQQLRSTGKHKSINLASNKPPTGQLSIVLAIVAVVALALVAGTYARLYLLRKDS
jgi:hypothetical protein